MKKMIFSLIAMLTMSISAKAMSFEQAQREALFLTDKMAYELNLTQEQYDAAYEINLDYLMGVTSVDDVYGTYWSRRNADLGYILLDWQWNAYCAASYFYRPLYWDAGYWHFGVYARYPRRTHFYFDRPSVFISYRGGHSWHRNGGHSWYNGRSHEFHRGHGNHVGMRDHLNKGTYQGNRHYGRGSSTRVTVNNNKDFNNKGGNFGSNRIGSSFNGSRNTTSNNRSSYNNSRNVTGNRSSSFSGNRSSSFGSNRSNSGTFSGNRSSSTTRNSAPSVNSSSKSSNRSGGGFGGNRSGGSQSSGGSHSGGGSRSGGFGHK